MKLLITTIFIAFFALSVNAQQCATLEDCNNKLSEAAKIINKLLDIDKAKDDLIAAKNAEIESRKQLDLVNAQLIKKREETIAEQDKLIRILEKKTGRQIRFLWGILTIRF